MKPLIIFHGDGDGICSAALLSLYVLNKEKTFPYFLSPDFNTELTDKEIELIRKINPDHIYILDIPIDEINPAIFEEYSTMIIDHHPYENPPSSVDIIHSIGKCTTTLVYENFAIDEKEAWIAALGAYSDKDPSYIKHLNLARKYYEIDENFLKKALRLVASVQLFGIEAKKTAVLSLIEAYNLSIPTALLGTTPNSSKLVRFSKKAEREKLKALSTISQNKIFENDRFVIFKINHALPIHRYLSNVLANTIRQKVVVVLNEKGKHIYFEARTRELDDIDLGKLFRKICQDLRGSGGGHPKAAGGKFPRYFLEAFLRKFS